MSSSDDDDDKVTSQLPDEEEGPSSPMSPSASDAVTSAAISALARVGVDHEEAAQLLSDPALLEELRESYHRIRVAKSLAADADSTLGGALAGTEGLSGADIAEMMAEIDGFMEQAQKAAAEDGESPSSQRRRVNGDEDDDDEGADEEQDNDEFGQLIESITAAKSSSSQRRRLDLSLLPLMPLLAEYCGATVTLFGLTRVCGAWRALLLSPARALQRTLWIGIACTEFPVEVSEMGEDAFVSVCEWSSVVRGIVKMKYRKELQVLVAGQQ